MTKLLQEAIEVLKEMPEDRQETVARAIINYAADDDAVQLSDDQITEIERRVAKSQPQVHFPARARQATTPSWRMRVIVDENAWRDLEGIARRIAADDPLAARAQVEKIRHVIDQLAAFPPYRVKAPPKARESAWFPPPSTSSCSNCRTTPPH